MTAQATPTAAPDKRFSTLQAELARRGYELRQGTAGEFYIIRWGMVRELRDLDAATAAARQLGVPG